MADACLRNRSLKLGRVFGLQGEQLGDRVAPALWPGAPVGGTPIADNGCGLLGLATSAIARLSSLCLKANNQEGHSWNRKSGLANEATRTALIGDSAHAIVPFHGQGMNCCFEDCVEFDACMGRHSSWESVFAEFGALRKPNTDAIRLMTLDNYLEMRERVADPKFQLQQALSLELERRFPQYFIPRYSMVMFHHEIPYRIAYERGAVQAQLLAELTAGAVSTLDDVDFERAEHEIRARLAPLS